MATDALVVGLPLNMDGSPGEMSARARNSPAASTAASTCRYTDERLTTFGPKASGAEQHGRAIADGRSMPAAALLLEGWLNDHAGA